MDEKPLLICMMGLPRSGKTTWAQAQEFPIVNPDSIRFALHGHRYLALAEPFIWAIAQVMVRALFLAGHATVILDATNTTRKRRDAWKCDDWVTVFKDIETNAVTCTERAQLEDDQDIMPIIEKMAAEFERLGDDEEAYHAA
jgi:predicted kinase